MSEKKQPRCSFCLRPKSEVQMLIAGAEGHICENCVEQAMVMLEQELDMNDTEAATDFGNGKLLKPVEIKKFLDEYVIGQDDAKKVMAVAIYNHYKRLNQPHTDDEVEIEKSNIIMVGETGTGKTLLARSIAKLLNVPFTIVDATVFTEAGYVGEDVESILSRLLQSCNYDIAAAEKGIVYIDEIDKVGRKGDNPSITRDVSGEGVQQAMLKLLEGADVLVPPQGGRKHPDQKMVKINTQNILFICGGAFEGIDKMIGRRMQSTAIGYSATKNDHEVDRNNMLQYITSQDLRAFGLIPELLGRLPVVTYLNALDRDSLKLILTEPKNALVKQYKKLFDLEGIKLSIEPDVVDYLVDKAVEFKLGARGLRSICETVMGEAMFTLPSQDVKEFVLTLEYAQAQMEKSKLQYLKVA